MGSKAATDLLELIDWKATECLNESPDHTLQNVLKQGYREDGGLLLQSDTDEQLLVHVAFTAAAKLMALSVCGPSDGHAPKRVKLFMNRSTIGFSEASDETAVQTIDLTPAHLAGESIPLRLAKFQGVNVLSIFVEDNQGDEEVTHISKIVISGSAGESMNVGDIKKEEAQ